MADIFYFTSPRKPGTVARYRPSARRTLKVVRQRRAVPGPDMFHPRACVAQYDEPTFCPSDASLLYLSLPPVHGVTGTRPNIHSSFCLRQDRGRSHLAEDGGDHDAHEDDDDEEEQEEEEEEDEGHGEEPGGAPLPPSEHDAMTDAHDDLYVAERPAPFPHDRNTPPGFHMNEEPSHPPDRYPTRQDSIIPQPRRRSHPRPVTRAMGVDEHGRWIREGDVLDGGPRLDVAASAAPVQRTGSASLQTGAAGENNQQSPHPIAPSQPSRQAPARGIDPPIPIPNTHHALAMDIDDDALAVNDPRRHYSVADFMDTWRLHSIADKRLPPFAPGVQPSIRLGRPLEQVTRAQTMSGAVDMQGIRWQLMGPPRQHASVARSMLHPSGGTGCGHQPSPYRYRSSAIAGEVESHYRFRAFLPQHRASFEHYQLRNVLVATDRNNIFYGTAGDTVMRASLTCPTVQPTVMDLSTPENTAAGFRITCLAASPGSSSPGYRGDNVLIAVGFHGGYAVLDTNSDRGEVSQGFVTHAYNGLVTHVHSYPDRRSGLLRASFCSNDRQVRLMDVPTLRFTDSFTYDSAVNCSATSADGRLRVLVGDNTDTIITDAQRGTPLVRLPGHADHGFACAWSHEGRHVATAAQDGRVVVWDARHWSSPLRTFESVMSCARSLHFTDGGALVAAENEDVVTVYDGPGFDHQQEMRFFGSIAGVALLDGGAELAVANADQTVGGLLTFERQPHGLYDRSHRRHVMAKPGAHGSARWRNGRALRGTEYLPSVLV